MDEGSDLMFYIADFVTAIWPECDGEMHNCVADVLRAIQVTMLQAKMCPSLEQWVELLHHGAVSSAVAVEEMPHGSTTTERGRFRRFAFVGTGSGTAEILPG